MTRKPTCTLTFVIGSTSVTEDTIDSFVVSGIPRTHILSQRTTPDGSHIFTLTKRTGRK